MINKLDIFLKLSTFIVETETHVRRTNQTKQTWFSLFRKRNMIIHYPGSLKLNIGVPIKRSFEIIECSQNVAFARFAGKNLDECSLAHAHKRFAVARIKKCSDSRWLKLLWTEINYPFKVLNCVNRTVWRTIVCTAAALKE